MNRMGFGGERHVNRNELVCALGWLAEKPRPCLAWRRRWMCSYLYMSVCVLALQRGVRGSIRPDGVASRGGLESDQRHELRDVTTADDWVKPYLDISPNLCVG